MVYDEFYDWVLENIGLDLKAYKQNQLIRRIESLMTRASSKSLGDYKKLISENEIERNKFIDFITINVTEFFRNPELFSQLEIILKREFFCKNKKGLKIWSAACSLGCEPYSIAMMLKENGIKDFEIIATDIDNKILKRAKEGIYTDNEYKNISKRYEKYFTKRESSYVLSREITSLVNFQRSDLILDKYKGSFDLILCRNVVIYFNADAKNMVYKKFEKSLNKGGLLFVGATECIYNAQNYGLEKLSAFIYRKI